MLARLRSQLPGWRRALRRRRRLLALLTTALLATALLPLVLPPSVQGSEVLVSAVELPAGTVLAAEHLEVRRVAAELVPVGARADPEELLGRRTALGLPPGTPLLPGMLEGSRTAVVPDGTALMAVPVPPVLTARLGPGTRIEILAGDPLTGERTSIPARVVELSSVESGGALPGGSTGDDQEVLVAVPIGRTGDLAHAVGQGAVAIAILG